MTFPDFKEGEKVSVDAVKLTVKVKEVSVIRASPTIPFILKYYWKVDLLHFFYGCWEKDSDNYKI